MKLLLGLLLCILVVGLALGGWYGYVGGTARTVYRTAHVERGNLLASIAATGIIQAEEVVDVGAQVAGQIKSFGTMKDPADPDKTRIIDYCCPVEKNTILAELDDSLYRARVMQAKASLQRAEADLLGMQAKYQQAERDWRRVQDLGPKKAISNVEYDTIRATFESARALQALGDAAVTQARATLQEAEINLGYCTIRSPVKGVIIDRRVNIGQTVVASLNAPSLFLIAKDLNRLQVWASVNEADIGSIEEKQPVRFSVDAFPEIEFKGVVSQIRLNAQMTQNVVTYTVVVNTDNSTGKLKPYMTANLQFVVSERKNVLFVPNTALRWRPQLLQVAEEEREAYAKSLRRRSSSASSRGDKPEKDRHPMGTLWFEDNGFVRPVRVRTGLSDGVATEILDTALEEGTIVVTGVQQQASESTVNPFTPQFGGRKKQESTP